MSRLVLGIDAGGTRTVAAAADESEVLGIGRAGPGNYQVVGLESAAREIAVACERALAAAGADGKSVAAAWAGLSGLNSRDDSRRLGQALRELMPGVRLECDNDAFNCLATVTAGPGVAVIAGTGSIAVGLDGRGKRARAGGWGYIMGDEGSGYEVGRMALRAVCRALDGRGPSTLLEQLVTDQVGARSPEDLYRRVYVQGMARHEIAALSQQVAGAADDGDVEARRIMARAGQELALAARTVISRLGLDADRFSLALCGGLFLAGRWVIEPFLKAVRELAPRAVPERPTSEPVMGAVRLARSLLDWR